MMSNDVQIARVAKIGADLARRQQQRDIKPISKGGGGGGGGGGVMGDDIEFVFGSISPRGGGGVGQHRHIVDSIELDSPEHTQRDTTESDNNISSCSTLDIVNKVSDRYADMHRHDVNKVNTVTWLRSQTRTQGYTRTHVDTQYTQTHRHTDTNRHTPTCSLPNCQQIVSDRYIVTHTHTHAHACVCTASVWIFDTAQLRCKTQGQAARRSAATTTT